MSVRIGIDTGGTFTDVILFDEDTGTIHTTKTPSTPPAFETGVLTGLDKILEQTGIAGTDVAFLSNGTTVGTNAVLESEVPRLGLITNEGLRDVLEIGDQTRPELYNLQTDKPPHLIDRYLRKEVPGRINAMGEEVDPLDEDAARAVISELDDAGVEAIVVVMIFSYLNDTHERRIGELIDEVAPGTDYALSSQVHPEIREYDRTITTVLNQGIKSTVQDYFARLDEGIANREITSPVNVMHSGGGLFSTSQAADHAIRTVLSGPAAGAVAARHISHTEGFPNSIGMDMGGTSADVSIIRDHTIVRTTEGEINNLPINTPMIDISTVGAGGGSVGWIDEGGALRVGPMSAGADPGPICYGQGGTQPTLTDANLLLGRINPDAFLAGEMTLIEDQTRDVFHEDIAAPIELPLEEAALALVDVANANLARQIRRVTVERGNDPAEFSLVAFGGAGPLQAPAVAREMGIQTVIVPPSPGVFSARGLLIADIRVDEAHAHPPGDIDPAVVDDQFNSLAEALRGRFRAQGFDPAEPTLERTVDMRYQGQSYEISVAAPSGTFDEDALSTTVDRFHAEHARLYGHAIEGEPTEIVTLRMNGHISTPTIADSTDQADGPARMGERDVYFKHDDYLRTAVYDRRALAVGEEITGPAILEESGSTSLVPPDATARVSEAGSVLIHINNETA